MPTVRFQSLDDADVIEMEFVPLEGDVRRLRLLVDSGFTGKSSFVLGHDAVDLIRAEMPPAEASGALQGQQDRAWVMCRLPELSFQHTCIAIIADLVPLSLPPNVQGMAGLSFLRRFARWGAERTASGWEFWLSDGNA